MCVILVLQLVFIIEHFEPDRIQSFYSITLDLFLKQSTYIYYLSHDLKFEIVYKITKQ